VRKCVVVILLALFLLGPGVVAAEPIVCDYALDSGKLLDWLVCVLKRSRAAGVCIMSEYWWLHMRESSVSQCRSCNCRCGMQAGTQDAASTDLKS
jgi:hypothetical protein